MILENGKWETAPEPTAVYELLVCNGCGGFHNRGWEIRRVHGPARKAGCPYEIVCVSCGTTAVRL